MENHLDKRLEQNNIKPTSMRRLVLNVLIENQKALSLHDIEGHFDNVDRSTIFRTLKTFQDNSLIHSVDDGTGAIKYALCDDYCSCNLEDLHIHFLCIKCGQTHCLRDIAIPVLDMPEGFDLKSANFVAKGTCPDCR